MKRTEFIDIVFAQVRGESAEKIIKAADELVADRPCGEWKYLHGSIGSYMTMSCPFCGETFNDVAEWKYNFCPNCGAMMVKGSNNAEKE